MWDVWSRSPVGLGLSIRTFLVTALLRRTACITYFFTVQESFSSRQYHASLRLSKPLAALQPEGHANKVYQITMKLDTKSLRYLNPTDWRTLTGVETGSRNHEVVPTSLIATLSKSSVGDVQRSISILAKTNLIAKVKNAKYDGYRLTYGGLDYLALHSLQKAGVAYSVGNQIGVGKESDIFVVSDEKGEQRVLKIHRLGRVSFKKGVRNKRDYARTRIQKERGAGSWMYMSRLAAVKEHTFMQALKEAGMAVPTPLGQNRHQIIMSLVDGFPLRQIDKVPDPAGLYAELMDMIIQLASLGLIHGDFNEFNILIKEEEVEGTDGDVKLVPVLIDFPQMVSVDHADAEYYFQRDVNCVRRFFERRYGFVSDEPGPFFKDAKKMLGRDGTKRLDVNVEASGFSKKMARELETYMKEHGIDGDAQDRNTKNIDEDASDDTENEEDDHEHEDLEQTVETEQG